MRIGGKKSKEIERENREEEREAMKAVCHM